MNEFLIQLAMLPLGGVIAVGLGILVMKSVEAKSNRIVKTAVTNSQKEIEISQLRRMELAIQKDAYYERSHGVSFND